MMENENTRSKKVFAPSDVSLFCAQAALILKSGISLQDGILALTENMNDERGEKVIADIADTLSMNRPFYEALKEVGGFPPYMVGMVEIGEKAGELDGVLESLSEYYDREDKLKKSIRSAVFYPMLLFAMMSAVIVLLIARVMPIFSGIYADLGGEMPELAVFIMNSGKWLGWISLGVAILFAAFLIFVFFFATSDTRAVRMEGVLYAFGPTKKILHKINSSRFAAVMSMMLASGYGLEEAFKLLPGVIESPSMRKKVQDCGEKIISGIPVAQAINSQKLFAGIHGRMIGIGAKTGNLESVMSRISEIYDEEVEHSLSRTVSLIEPVIVAVLSVVIGAILLSVMLPLMGILTSIR